MRDWIVAAVVAITALAPAGACRATPKVGHPAPDFTVTTLGGRTVRLADLKGEVVVLNFWATWCAPCKRELPMLEAALDAYRKDGLEVLAIATADSLPPDTAGPAPIPFARHIEGPYRDLGAVPTNYVIDRSGKLVYAAAGAFDLDDLRQIVIPLLKAPPPAASTTAQAAARPDAGM